MAAPFANPASPTHGLRPETLQSRALIDKNSFNDQRIDVDGFVLPGIGQSGTDNFGDSLGSNLGGVRKNVQGFLHSFATDEIGTQPRFLRR